MVRNNELQQSPLSRDSSAVVFPLMTDFSHVMVSELITVFPGEADR